MKTKPYDQMKTYKKDQGDRTIYIYILHDYILRRKTEKPSIETVNYVRES